MAVFLARDLADGEELQVGIGLPVPEAAVRLAHMMHGPNMELIFLGARMNVAHLDYLPLPEFGWDRRVVRWTESFSDRGHRFDHDNPKALTAEVRGAVHESLFQVLQLRLLGDAACEMHSFDAGARLLCTDDGQSRGRMCLTDLAPGGQQHR